MFFSTYCTTISESLKTKELTSTYAMDTDTLELKQMKNEAHFTNADIYPDQLLFLHLTKM